MKWLMFFLAFSITACASSPVTTPIEQQPFDYSSKLPDDAAKAYLNGKILILYGYSNPASTSEAFADWQAYLNDYLSSSGESIYHTKISAKSLAELTRQTVIEPEFTLFLKKDSPSYYYSDFIVEPQVYRAVEAAYSGKLMTDEDNAFLPEQLQP